MRALKKICFLKKAALIIIFIFFVFIGINKAYCSWETTTLINNLEVGAWVDTSLAVDSSGHIHISYYDPKNQDLKYVTNSSGTWKTQTIDSPGNVGKYSSLSLDSSGFVHIAYHDNSNAPPEDESNTSIKYATNAKGVWLTQTVDNNSYRPSITIDKSGHAHISYSDILNNDLKYATNNENSWTIQIVDNERDNSISDTAIAIDSLGKVHIAYYKFIDDNGDIHGYLKYATNLLGIWATTTVDYFGYRSFSGYTYCDLAIDSQDKVHISYYHYIDYDLKYANNVSGFWDVQMVDSKNDVSTLGKCNSIGVDSSNKIHIGYLEQYGCDPSCNSRLKYATNTTGTWVSEVVDNTPQSGADASLYVDKSNNIYISYTSEWVYDKDFYNGNLKYTSNIPIMSPDTDGDGMPDIWENQYGLNPLANDASLDKDSDGYSNLKEYLASTDPTDPNSKPKAYAMPWIPLLLLND